MELERLLAAVEKEGYDIGGDRLKSAPRGFDKERPRIELLRHKTLFVGRTIGFDPVIHTADVLDLIREDWRAVRPVVDWIQRNAGA